MRVHTCECVVNARAFHMLGNDIPLVLAPFMKQKLFFKKLVNYITSSILSLVVENFCFK